MSRSDKPILSLIRYIVVATRLQLSHFYCPDTTPRAGCLCGYPICMIVTVSTYALFTFHIERVCTVREVWALASRHSRATTLFGELRSPTIPKKASSPSNIVHSPCSRRYHQYKLRFLVLQPSEGPTSSTLPSWLALPAAPPFDARPDCSTAAWKFLCERLHGRSFARSLSMLDNLMLCKRPGHSFTEYVHFMG
jgi:hypothetical protein